VAIELYNLMAGT